jgi:hypothetical protein
LEINEKTNKCGKVEVIILEESSMFLGNKKIKKQKESTTKESPKMTNATQKMKLKC